MAIQGEHFRENNFENKAIYRVSFAIVFVLWQAFHALFWFDIF